MTDFGERLLAAFQNAGVAEIARKLDITYQAVKNYAEGRIPSAEMLIKISDSTQCSIHWLLTGEGPKSRADINALLSTERAAIVEGFIPVYLEEHLEEKLRKLAIEENEKVEDEAAKLIIEAMIARGVVTDKMEGMQLQFFGDYEIALVSIPLLGTIAAGLPIQVFDSAETVLVAEEFIIPGRNSFALRVQGDSMIDEGILDRDLIIVMETSEAHPGQTVVALIDGDQATVKKFYRRGRQIVLRPANPLHKDMVLAPERVQIRGVVIGIQRRT